jgi:uncharacterized protein YydD (DUF2326 family)
MTAISSYNPKQVKQIKEIVNFLNSEIPTNRNEKTFVAYHPRNRDGASLDVWHVTCNDMLMYMKDEELKLCKEAVREKFPKLKIVFCYLHNVTRVIVKDKGAIIIK